MISANDLRAVQFSHTDRGYSIEEVNAVLDKAADTIDALDGEKKELYHKLEVLAAKVEEYRNEEDSIKTALITAQKMADKITKEAREESDALLAESKAQAEGTVTDAKSQADSLISQARNYAADLLKTKTEEADGIVDAAEQKANEAISSANIVAQDIVTQAKANYEELTSKAREEKDAYVILINALKKDAASFIEQLKILYAEQFSKLERAKIDTDEAAVDESEVTAIHSEAEGLLEEIDDIQQSIPDAITIEKPDYSAVTAEEQPAAPAVAEEPVAAAPVAEEPVDEVEEIIEEITEAEETIPEAAPATDPMAAVEAFSHTSYSPIDTGKRELSEIAEEPQMEEKSLFDRDDDHQPFETFFDVSKKDAHFDKTQQISLLPPDDDEEDDDDEHKGFKGFFKKKK